MTRRPAPKALTRKTATRPERRTFVIYCEGQRSEPAYIRALRGQPGIARSASVKVEIAREHGSPHRIIEFAADRARDPEVDECWCVFDVESPQPHPNLQHVTDIARTSGVHLAISNPCFELWLILHHTDHTAALTTRQAVAKRAELDGRRGKHVDGDAYMARRHNAIHRAKLLEDRHRGNRPSFPADNPSSTMYNLVAALETVRVSQRPGRAGTSTHP
ncbi:MAG: RloB family protein [Bifidobacteriaceae bacterium]|jgi:hypothetical protein|nr:RloB family protein [Bifidobacteriaceae bacterium]